MHAVSVLSLAGILAVSANINHGSFRYDKSRSFRRNEETCRVCYGDACTTLTQSRCDYYVEAESILDKEQDAGGEETEVDEMVYDLVEHAAQSWTIQECLPLISAYTDCNKDNICIGCKSCQCTLDGRWSCKEVQQCQPLPELEVDHLVLVTVINALENIPEEKSTIMKRSISNYTKENKIDKQTTFVAIAEWMYGVTPNVVNIMENRTAVVITQDSNQTDASESSDISNTLSTKPRASFIPTPETDYIDFDEVLKNIANEGSHYRRRKPQLKENITYDDNNDLGDIQVFQHNDSKPYEDVLNDLEEGNDGVTEDVPSDATFVIDLLAYNNKNETKDINNETDDIINILNKDSKNGIDDVADNYRFGIDALIKKRDVSSVNYTNTTEIATTTETENNLNDTVYIPLINIIEGKQNELSDLMQIKENLLSYMNKNNTTERILLNGSNTYFSIYKLDLLPEISSSLRQNNPNTLEKLLYKLKRDIYEVRRDIAAIQKISEVNDLPSDLKMLINAMRKYSHRQRNSSTINVIQKDNKNFNKITRRNGGSDSAVSIKGQFIDILESLDKHIMPDSNVMVISRDAKKIINRVINQYNVDGMPPFSIRLSDTAYNLTNDLDTIGNDWSILISNVENSPPSEFLYALKLLHLNLCRDMNKISDAMSLIDFARSRRMFLIESPDDAIMEKINKGFDSIRNKVQTIIERKKAIKSNKDNKDITMHKSRKKSFMQKLRNLLRSSKKEIVEMSNKNIPKSEIVRTIAKKKLDEIVQSKLYEDEKTMIRWQNNLNVLRRK